MGLDGKIDPVRVRVLAEANSVWKESYAKLGRSSVEQEQAYWPPPRAAKRVLVMVFTLFDN